MSANSFQRLSIYCLSMMMLFCGVATANAADSLSAKAARELVQPFYDFLSGKVSADQGFANIAPHWRSFGSNEGSRGVEETTKSISALRNNNVSDLTWDIVEVISAGEHIIVRGEARGTPAKAFFGVPHGGKSFKIMSIDIHKVAAGKVETTWHVENWADAMRQLAAAD